MATESINVHDATAGVDIEAASKRRKVRKGTRSCWGCKRRKMKCSFEASPTPSSSASPEVDSCLGCQKRGSKCVSQEFEIPDELSIIPKKRAKSQIQGKRKEANEEQRIMKVEAMLEQLVKKAGTTLASTTSEDGWTTTGFPTPMSMDVGCSKTPNIQQMPEGLHPNQTQSKCDRARRELFDSLPSREDVKIIMEHRDPVSILIDEKLTTPYPELKKNGLRSPDTLLEMPRSDTHPILVARWMLKFATFLQIFLASSPDIPEGLSENPVVLMNRMAESASIIISRDECLGNLEGLECIMIESLYQHNAGNLRQSWVGMRKAMIIAQLMGFHRSETGGTTQYKILDPRSRNNPQYIWFRILFFDRHFCLMLGLPQGSLDRTMANNQAFADDTPMGKFERMHCVLASRILELTESAPSEDHFAQTMEIDTGLQRAARNLPAKSWLRPVFPNTPMGFFDSMGLLFNQLFHYNLLIQLHIPYMLRPSKERQYDYSKITCVNASREVLSRFLSFRKFSCRPLDFFALMAAMTLLLSHLDSHRYKRTENVLAHQYPSDRAMIEQTQENFKEISLRDGDNLTAKSAALLVRLLEILGEAADGNARIIESVSVSVKAPETEMEEKPRSGAVQFFVPYCGIIKIAREGVISKEIPRPQYALASSGQGQSTSSTGRVGVDSGTNMIADQKLEFEHSSMLPSHLVQTDGHISNTLSPYGSGIGAGQPLEPGHQFQDFFFDSLLEPHYPLLTAGVDDWTFQGVDTAFFNSLMKGAEENDKGEAEWPAWENGT